MLENSWRLEPARQVEDLFAWLCPGSPYPPELTSIKFAISFRLRYTLIELPATMLLAARTQHNKRIILLPDVCEEKQREMLIHEISEIFLRLPCSAEYSYQPQGNADEFHRVSTLVHRRARRESRRTH